MDTQRIEWDIKTGFKDIAVNLDCQRDRKRYASIWIDKEIERDMHQSGLTKSCEGMDVDRQEIETNIVEYTKNGQR